jgi:hypothetical protein
MKGHVPHNRASASGWSPVSIAVVEALDWNGLTVSGYWLLECPRFHTLYLVDCCPQTDALFLRPLTLDEVTGLPFAVHFLGVWSFRSYPEQDHTS